MKWRLGVDTGGTFTDVVAYDTESGEWRAGKIWSSDDIADCINNSLVALNISPETVSAITYGTTKITNAIVQNELAQVAFVTTCGFKDVLRIARQKREPLYNFKVPHRSPPPVPEDHSFEVDERCTYDGTILRAVDESAVATLVDSIPDECEAIAVSLLHSYANGENERTIARIFSRRFADISVSHEVSPQSREYERSVTTVMNAAMLPLIRKLISSLGNIRIPVEKLRFFHSGGGLTSVASAAKHPLGLALSGPAAGVQAAAAIAKELKIPKAVSLDMGGTTTDCSLIIGGAASLSSETKVGSVPIRQPTVFVQSIGAGGGSVVRYERGRLTVGPDSAGASPGPACYCRGGKMPTLTDAAAVLGLFGDAGEIKRPVSVDVAAARDVFTNISAELGMTIEELASGTIAVASALAARAIRSVTMNSGVDARSCALIAFGGTGPMFAPFVAQEIGMDVVIVPDQSSALSAFGCLTADPLMTRQWTVHIKMSDATPEKVDRITDDLFRKLSSEFQLGTEAGEQMEREVVGFLRYQGQSYEIEVPFELPFDPSQVTKEFASLHQRAYGFTNADPWEMAAIRVSIRKRSPIPTLKRTRSVTDKRSLGSSKCWFKTHGWLEAAQYRRENLRGDLKVIGPAIILDHMSTIVVPPEFVALADGMHLRLIRATRQNRSDDLESMIKSIKETALAGE